MAEPNQLDSHGLECLRFEADCRGLAKSVRSPELRSQLLRMAQTWLDLAESGPDAHAGESVSEAETWKI
jgi:hypothetical protein